MFDDEVFQAGDWNGSDISLVLDGFAPGTYLIEITVNDTLGRTATDLVGVFVIGSSTTNTTSIPTTTTTTPIVPNYLDITTIVIIMSVLATSIFIVVVIIFLRKKH